MLGDMLATLGLVGVVNGEVVRGRAKKLRTSDFGVAPLPLVPLFPLFPLWCRVGVRGSA